MVQLEAVSSCPIPCSLGAEPSPLLAPSSSQAVVGSNKVPPSLLFSRITPPGPSAVPHHTGAPGPAPAPLPFSGPAPAPQCLSCSEGPRAEHRIRGAASPVPSAGAQSLPWPCCHTGAGTGQDAGGFLVAWAQLLMFSSINQNPQLLSHEQFPAALFQAWSIAGGCCGPSAGLCLLEPHPIGHSPWTQPVQIPLQNFLPSSRSTLTPVLVSSANLHIPVWSRTDQPAPVQTSIGHYGPRYCWGFNMPMLPVPAAGAPAHPPPTLLAGALLGGTPQIKHLPTLEPPPPAPSYRKGREGVGVLHGVWFGAKRSNLRLVALEGVQLFWSTPSWGGGVWWGPSSILGPRVHLGGSGVMVGYSSLRGCYRPPIWGSCRLLW